MQVIFLAKHQESPGVFSFFFEPGGYTWTPGQYVDLILHDTRLREENRTRTFSIASSPREGVLRITTRIPSQGGIVSPDWGYKQSLLSLKEQESVTLSFPRGELTVSPTANRYAFVAGGIGITPFRAILKDVELGQNDAYVTLLYGTKDTPAIYQDELDALARKINLKVYYFIHPHIISGEDILRHVPPEGTHYFLSGPSGMVTSMRRSLEPLLPFPAQIKHDPLDDLFEVAPSLYGVVS